MADLTKRTVVELAQLGTFKDELLKVAATKTELSTESAKAVKFVKIDGYTLNFYKTLPVADDAVADISIDLPETDLSEIESTLETLTGGEGVTGSVKQIAKSYADGKDEAIAAAKKAGDDAQTTIDNYKTTNDAAVKAAQDAADAAQDDVDALEELVGAIPSTSEAETVIGYVNEQVAKATGDASQVAQDLADYKTTNDAAVGANKTAIENEVTRATGAEEALGNRIDDVEELIGTVEEGKTVMGIVADNLTEAKSYTDTEIGKLGSVLNFKGTVATVSALPTEGVKVGDVYHVTEKSAEYVYTTEGWEELGSVIDLSAYETIEGAEGKIATAKSEAITAAEGYADGLDEAMDIRMQAVEAAIGEGGSVQDKIDASIALLDATVTNEVEGQAKPDVTVTVVEEDGKLKSVSATVNAKYDADGAAKAVQGETTKTVKDVQDEIDAIEYATDDDIKNLFK